MDGVHATTLPYRGLVGHSGLSGDLDLILDVAVYAHGFHRVVARYYSAPYKGDVCADTHEGRRPVAMRLVGGLLPQAHSEGAGHAPPGKDVIEDCNPVGRAPRRNTKEEVAAIRDDRHHLTYEASSTRRGMEGVRSQEPVGLFDGEALEVLWRLA